MSIEATDTLASKGNDRDKGTRGTGKHETECRQTGFGLKPHTSHTYTISNADFVLGTGDLPSTPPVLRARDKPGKPTPLGEHTILTGWHSQPTDSTDVVSYKAGSHSQNIFWRSNRWAIPRNPLHSHFTRLHQEKSTPPPTPRTARPSPTLTRSETPTGHSLDHLEPNRTGPRGLAHVALAHPIPLVDNVGRH